MEHRWLKLCGDLYYLRRLVMDEFGNAKADDNEGFLTVHGTNNPEVATINDELNVNKIRLK